MNCTTDFKGLRAPFHPPLLKMRFTDHNFGLEPTKKTLYFHLRSLAVQCTQKIHGLWQTLNDMEYSLEDTKEYDGTRFALGFVKYKYTNICKCITHVYNIYTYQ